MKTDIQESMVGDDFDLIIGYIKRVWSGRKTLFISITVFASLGVLIAVTSPVEYTASTVFVPQTSESNGGSGTLSGLAAMAGINLGTSGSYFEISPTLYQSILESPAFFKDLIQLKIDVNSKSEKISFFDYFTDYQKKSFLGVIKKYTVGLPGVIKKLFKSSEVTSTENSALRGIYTLSEEEYLFKEALSDYVKCEFNDELGYVTLACVMSEPLAAAQLVDQVKLLLQQYVTEYRVNKAKDELAFVEEQYSIKKNEFYLAEEQLAEYTDKNKNITSAKVNAEYKRLNSVYNLKMTIYNELAKQLEQAKLKVAHDTPSFSIIKDVTLPNEKSAPKRIQTIIIWSFLGGICGISMILSKGLLERIKKAW